MTSLHVICGLPPPPNQKSWLRQCLILWGESPLQNVKVNYNMLQRWRWKVWHFHWNVQPLRRDGRHRFRRCSSCGDENAAKPKRYGANAGKLCLAMEVP